MTKEESLAWVKSLKPGDIVIYSGFGVAGRIQTAKVEKVTPSGIVRTNRGSFKESPWSWSGRVGGYGKTLERLARQRQNCLSRQSVKKRKMLLRRSGETPSTRRGT